MFLGEPHQSPTSDLQSLIRSRLLSARSWTAASCGESPSRGNQLPRRRQTDLRSRPGERIKSPLFIFDTGAPNSIIDTALAKRLHIDARSSGTIHGAGKGDIPGGDAGEMDLTIGKP
jgi:hypothetical protein